MRIEVITSAQNPKVKDLLALQEKSRERRKKGLFVVEGRRELQHCIESGFEPQTLFICREIISDKDFDAILGTIEENFCGLTVQIIDLRLHIGGQIPAVGTWIGDKFVLFIKALRNT